MIVNSVNQVLYLYFFLYFKHYFTFLLSTKKKENPHKNKSHESNLFSVLD